MRSFIILSLLIISGFGYTQNPNKRQIFKYANMSSFSLASNTTNYYAMTDKETSNGNSISFDLNTIHGIKFFEIISVSAGISLDLNINKTFVSTPFIVDLRLFSSRSNENGFFAYLQTGRNIKWSDSFNGNGVTAKLGAGVIIKKSENTCMYIDTFIKSKSIETQEFKEKGKYQLNGFGMSIGLTFN